MPMRLLLHTTIRNSKNLIAGREFLNRFEKIIKEGKNFVIESTLSGKYLVNKLIELRKSGYHIKIMFVFLDSVEISISRVKNRVIKGGHNIPEEIIRRRYKRSIQNFWNLYKDVAHDWAVFDNSGDEFIRVVYGEFENYKLERRDLFINFMKLI